MESGRARWMISYVTALHASWGVILTLSLPTPEEALARIQWAIFAQVIGLEFLRVLMLVASACALPSLRLSPTSWQARLLLLPQHTLVLMSAFGGVAVHFGSFGADLPTPRVWLQSANGLLMGLFYTLAVLDRGGEGGLAGISAGVRLRSGRSS